MLRGQPVSKLSKTDPTNMLLTYMFIVIAAAVVIGIVLTEHPW